MAVDIAQRDALYRAIMIGNWEIAKVIFRSDEDALTAAIDNDGNTPLHLAVGTGNLNFVDNLLKMIMDIDPEILLNRVNDIGWTALHCAAVFGNIQATKKLVEKKPELLYKAG